MNNRQIIILIAICGVVFVGVGVASFWLGTRHGSKQTREDFQVAGHSLFEALGEVLPSSENIEPEATRQIGFHNNNLA